MNVTVTVKVSLRIQACGKGSWAVRGIPSCSCIRQQCGQTLHSVLFFQMCSVLNSTSHNRECSEGLTVNGLQVITPPHNMYCTGTQELGTSATQPNDDTRRHTRRHTHTHHTTHTHTHTHTHTRTRTIAELTLLYREGNILCIMAKIGHSPPLLWIQNNCLPFGFGLHCPRINVGCKYKRSSAAASLTQGEG